MEEAPNLSGTPVLWQRYKSGESIVSPLVSENAKSKIRKFKVSVSDEVVLLAGYYTEQFVADDRVKGLTFMVFDKNTKSGTKQTQVSVPKDLAMYTKYSTENKNKYKDAEDEIPALTITDIKEWEGHGYVVMGERRYSVIPYQPKGEPRFPYQVNAVAFVSLVDYSLSKLLWTAPVCKYYDALEQRNGSLLFLEKDKVNVFFNSDDSMNKKHDEAPLYGTGLVQMTINPEGKYDTHVIERIDDLFVLPWLMKPVDGRSLFVVAGKSSKERFGIIRW